MFNAGYISRKKHKHRPRTEEDGGDAHELARKKKVKRSNTDTEADASSSESDHSCFVAFVTASNLHKDALYLPQDLTNSVGLKRKCSEIVITDERERSWPMDLRFNKSSDTFYISRGWRSFCHENGKKAGGIFVCKLVGNRKTPVLSFCSTESFNDGTKGDKNNEENCMELESKKKRMRCRDSTSPSLNRFVKVTLTHYSLTNSRQHLPLPFTRENGFVKPGIINLLGKDGTKWKANLIQEADGRMSLGKGWKAFAKANGLKIGESFALEAILENGTPMLSFYSTESINDGTEGDKNNKENCLEPESRDSTLPSQNRFVKVTLTHDSLRKGRLGLPLPYTRENGLVKPGIIKLLGKDGTMWEANLLREPTGRMSLGKSWKSFAKANGLNIGESFTLEVIWENGTPMLSLYSIESINDGTKGDKNNKENRMELKSKKKRMRWSPSQNRFVKVTLTHGSLRHGRLGLPLPFMRENGLLKPRIINLLGKDGTKWEANLRREPTGRMRLGKGWKDFAKANGLNIGDSFTLEVISKNRTPMLSLFSLESTSINMQQRECSKDNEKDPKSTEPSGGNKTSKATNNKEEKRDSSSAIKSQFVTLTLTPEDVRDCKLILPSEFMKANGIKKLGKITLLGQKRMKWFGYLLSKDGIVAMGSGWKGFCEANGVKTGESFTLEWIYEQDTTDHVFKFSSNSVE